MARRVQGRARIALASRQTGTTIFIHPIVRIPFIPCDIGLGEGNDKILGENENETHTQTSDCSSARRIQKQSLQAIKMEITGHNERHETGETVAVY